MRSTSRAVKACLAALVMTMLLTTGAGPASAQIGQVLPAAGEQEQAPPTSTVTPQPAPPPAAEPVRADPSTPRPQTAQVLQTPMVRNVAIFVKNAAGSALDEKTRALEELVATRITDLGFSVISRDDAVNAVASFAKEGANAGMSGDPAKDLDALLSKQTSALRLAQNMGADYVFVVTMTTYGSSVKKSSAYGVDTRIVSTRLRVSYKLLDQFVGGTLTGDTVEAVKQTRQDENLTDEPDVLNDLLDEAAVKLARSLQTKAEQNRIREVAGDANKVNFAVSCAVRGLTLPDVVKNANGDFVLTTHICRVEALNVNVELDGVVVGTAPGSFKGGKGMHKMRLSRAGCRPWEQTVSLSEGSRFDVDLDLTDEAYARWKDTILLLQGMKADAKLTDADAEAVRGLAQAFRQSGFRVDLRSYTPSPNDPTATAPAPGPGPGPAPGPGPTIGPAPTNTSPDNVPDVQVAQPAFRSIWADNSLIMPKPAMPTSTPVTPKP